MEPETRDPGQIALDRVGTLLNEKWQIDALLGRGGMANVYAATNRSTRARVAIKVLLLEFAQDQDVRERFVREARIANSIQHPATVAVLDEGLSDRGEIFLVMELLEGKTLDVIVKERDAVSLADKLALFDPVLDVLGECHAAGIIHRDIKPANIFQTNSGQIKVLDFGIARLREGQGAVEATKQGTVLGTPAYMAPEQALGLSDLVDGRADLWSVGACIYTMLSGERVHRARSENESMVLAATKAAGSLALVAPDLPVEVVAFVDRSLAHDRTQRFADARAMRGALGALLAGIRAGQVTVAKKKSGGDAVVGRTEVTRDADAEGSTELRNQTGEVLRSIWRALSQFLSARAQYGPTHSLTLQPMRSALEEIGAALATRPDSLIWSVGPYAFTYADTPLWDGEKTALERIAFHVFSHGLRKIQFKAGLTEEELRRFLAIITRDKSSSIPLTDDPVADLWSQRFEHIGHLAIDAFASGTAEEVEAFEAEAAAVAEQAVEMSLVAKAWGQANDDSLEARAMQTNLLSGLVSSATVAASIALDAPARMLGAQIVVPAGRWEERLVEVLAAGVAEGVASGDAQQMVSALGSWTANMLSQGSVPAVFERLARVAAACTALRGPEGGRPLEQMITRAMLDRARLSEVLTRLSSAPAAVSAAEPASSSRGASAAPPPAESPVPRGVQRVLELLDDDSFFAPALEHWIVATNPEVAAALHMYVTRWSAGHEKEIGGVVETQAPPFALAMLTLLDTMATTDAAAALVTGLRNPHTDVRRAALQRVRGEEAQADLQRLLGDPSRQLRREVLAIISKLGLRALGPALVRRVQDPSFEGLELSERREWLTSLHVLNAARAEEIAIKMLSNAPLVPKEANDQNRLLAAQVLATAADTEQALSAVKTAAKKIWWNSPVVREAAQEAVAAISARRESKGGSA